MNRFLRGEKRHAFLGRCRPADDLLERANAELVARLQDAGRVREVLSVILVVVVIEFFRLLPNVLSAVA